MAQTKEEKAAYDKAYYAANREKIIGSKREKYEVDKVYREQAIARARSYRESNGEKVRTKDKAYYEANKEKLLAKRKAYREANRERVSSLKARYRALKLKQIPAHLRDCPTEKQRILQTYKLRSLLSEATGVQYHVDHMWPLADGGPHWSGNLQVIPAEENLSKSASVCEDIKATVIQSLYSFESDRPI